MTAGRAKTINDWLEEHCKTCTCSKDRGTDFVNCSEGCEVQQDVRIACIHYEAYVEPKEGGEE